MFAIRNDHKKTTKELYLDIHSSMPWLKQSVLELPVYISSLRHYFKSEANFLRFLN